MGAVEGPTQKGTEPDAGNTPVPPFSRPDIMNGFVHPAQELHPWAEAQGVQFLCSSLQRCAVEDSYEIVACMLSQHAPATPCCAVQLGLPPRSVEGEGEGTVSIAQHQQ
jgi:hypothetical protein